MLASGKFELIGDASAIISADLEPILPADVRNILLDVVLVWADLDVATSLFVSQVFGLNPSEGADKFGRKEIADKLKRAAKKLTESGQSEMTTKVSKIADAYPDKAFFRRRIAHSKCAGIRKSIPDCLVFLPYETEGSPNQLAIEILHLSKFVEAIAWAKEVRNLFVAHIDEADFFATQRSSANADKNP